MEPVAIIYVTDMDRSVDWYRRAVPGAVLRSSSPYWSEFESGGGTFALHVAGSVQRGSQVGIAFTADDSLEEIVAAWADGGIEPSRNIQNEPFGRSVSLTDPDGLVMQINEHGGSS